MSPRARAEYLAALRERYQRAPKAERSRLLDEICRTTHLHRKAVIRALRRAPGVGRPRPGRPRQYGPEVVGPLTQLWEVSDRLCGKLLVAVRGALLTALERHGALRVSPAVRAALLQLSPASIDRRLRAVRRASGRQPTRVGRGPTAAAAGVPIRTWGDWGAVAPGAVQADLVLHCGETTAGFFLCTLVVVDVATGWTDLEPVWGLGAQRVRGAVAQLHRRWPCALRHWHTDNGAEFLNPALLDYCRQHGLTVSRGRGYRKNDQAWVEHQNWLAVRRLIGRDRYASRAAFAVLHRLYGLLRLQLNLWRPTRKLLSKRRVGHTTRKTYDTPQTPYQRLLAADALLPAVRTALAAQLSTHNPAALSQQMHTTLGLLWTLAEPPAGRASPPLAVPARR